jgi:hypothetical protein
MCDVKVRFDHPFAACVAGVDVPLPDEARLFYVLPPRKPETSADGLILTGTPVGLVRGLALASAGTGGSAYDFPKVLDCAVSAEVSLDLATPSGTVRCEVPLTGWTPVARDAACARTGHPE